MAATTTDKTTWKDRALRRIREILASLPPDADDRRKRNAVRNCQPGPYAAATEVKAWRAAVRELLGPFRAPKPPEELPVPRTTGDAAVDGLLLALRETPWDPTIRLILADALEEKGDRRGGIIRTLQPKVERVMGRLWPGSYLVHVSGHASESRSEVHSKHGKKLMLTRDLCDMVEGRTMLADPDIVRAAEIERSVAVLKMFAED